MIRRPSALPGRLVAGLALVTALGLGCSAEPGGPDAPESPAGAADAGEAADSGDSAQTEEPRGDAGGSEGRPAPDFALQDLQGNPVSLESYRGRTVLVDFWATWCAPCVFQIPLLNDFYAEHKNEGVEVLGVSIDADGEEAILPFMEDNPIDYPVLLGDEGLARRFGAPGFPALFVVNPEGQIVYLHVGLAEEKELEEVLQQIRSDGEAA